MKFRYLGKTGLPVSELCLGAMKLGRETSEEDSFHILDWYVEEGGNFIDTADVYTRVVSESGCSTRTTMIMLRLRKSVSDGGRPNDAGLSRKHIISGVKASLQRMRTDYIDLYQVHAWDPRTPLEETLSTLNDLVREGLVRYTGASNFKGWEQFVCLQPQYNLMCRATEYELIDVRENEGLGVIPWVPLRGGWLSGKFTRDMAKPPEISRITVAEEKGYSETWDKYNNDFTWNLLNTLYSVAEEAEKTPAQSAINWLLQSRGVTAPIIGARNMEQLEANLGSAG